MKKKSDKEIESGIESNVGITYRAFSQFFALIAVIFMLTASVSYAVMANPSASIWTTDEDGNIKNDFAPEEIVYISGSDFNPDTQLTQIDITRPEDSDGNVITHVCPTEDELWCT